MKNKENTGTVYVITHRAVCARIGEEAALFTTSCKTTILNTAACY